jgi:hypothetical protein
VAVVVPVVVVRLPTLMGMPAFTTAGTVDPAAPVALTTVVVPAAAGEGLFVSPATAENEETDGVEHVMSVLRTYC